MKSFLLYCLIGVSIVYGSTVSPPQCPDDSKNIYYYNYEGDCSKYWECYAGKATVMMCPANLWWNEAISECDYQENVSCGGHTVNPEVRTTIKPTTGAPLPPAPDCPSDTEKIYFYNYQGDCSKYWECYAGKATVMVCPPNLWWNEAISECDYKDNVDCK